MFLTDFADAAVTLPLAALIAAALFLEGGARRALRWLAVAGATFAGVLALKVLFGFSPALQAATGVVSPSGHTAGSTIVYAGLMRVLGGGRFVTLAGAALVAVVVGVSRLELGAHTPSEVVLGALDGLAGAALLLRVVTTDALGGHRARLMLSASAALLVVALHGRHAPFEGMLQHWRASLAQDRVHAAVQARHPERDS